MPLFCRLATASVVTLILATLAVPNAKAVTIDMVTVGDPGNANDDTGYGSVGYPYQIAKYNVTIGQYADFLNAVAKADPYALYSAALSSNVQTRGISRSGTSGAYVYSVMSSSGIAPNGGVSDANRPISYVSWFDAARFANWMSNGQPTGLQGPTTTEDGAYTLNGATSGGAAARNAINPNTGFEPTFRIPTENEWYKAAYYSPNYGGAGVPGYFEYATQSDSPPGNLIGSGLNQANWRSGGVFSVTQQVSSPQTFTSNVGAFAGSASYYGTFDQSGNVVQWSDFDATAGSNRTGRGGDWNSTTALAISSARRDFVAPSTEGGGGFRLASPVPVPEPSTYAMALAGLACGGYLMWRQRK